MSSWMALSSNPIIQQHIEYLTDSGKSVLWYQSSLLLPCIPFEVPFLHFGRDCFSPSSSSFKTCDWDQTESGYINLVLSNKVMASSIQHKALYWNLYCPVNTLTFQKPSSSFASNQACCLGNSLKSDRVLFVCSSWSLWHRGVRVFLHTRINHFEASLKVWWRRKQTRREKQENEWKPKRENQKQHRKGQWKAKQKMKQNTKYTIYFNTKR